MASKEAVKAAGPPPGQVFSLKLISKVLNPSLWRHATLSGYLRGLSLISLQKISKCISSYSPFTLTFHSMHVCVFIQVLNICQSCRAIHCRSYIFLTPSSPTSRLLCGGSKLYQCIAATFFLQYLFYMTTCVCLAPTIKRKKILKTQSA